MVLVALIVFITPINNQLFWFFTTLNVAKVTASTLYSQLSPSPAYALITICILIFQHEKSMSTLLQFHYLQRSPVFSNQHSSHAPKENWSRHSKKWLNFARRFTCCKCHCRAGVERYFQSTDLKLMCSFVHALDEFGKSTWRHIRMAGSRGDVGPSSVAVSGRKPEEYWSDFGTGQSRWFHQEVATTTGFWA